jgi:TonB family protein
VREFHPTEPPQAPKPLEPLPEPPKLEAPVIHTDLPAVMQPQLQAVQRPAAPSPFENPPTQPAYDPGRVLPVPKVADAIRGVPGGQGQGGSGAAANLGPSPNSQDSSMQLLSDPKGVDFKPYLSALQARVNRYWQAMLPGIRVASSGRVSLQITIDQSGRVINPKYVAQSGLGNLDRAAMAAISASTPLPPFPKGFIDPTITLQLNFSYNLSK